MANFLINTAGSTIEGTTDADLVEFITGGSAGTVKGKDGNDILKATAGYGLQGITFFGNTGDDIVSAAGADVVDSNLQLGRGNDSAVLGGGDFNSSTIKGKLGEDTILITELSANSTASSLQVKGNQGDDTITVSAGVNSGLIIANSTFAGGAGEDTIVFSAGNTISGTKINGGLGEDLVVINDGSLTDSQIHLHSEAKSADLDSANTLNISATNVQSSSVKGGGADDTITLSAATFRDSTIRASLGDDTITMDTGAIIRSADIAAGKGADTIFLSGTTTTTASTLGGGQGDDTFNVFDVSSNSLVGGLGADSFSGDIAGITGNTFFFNTSTESTFTSRDTISFLDATTTGGSFEFGFNTSNNVSVFSGSITTGTFAALDDDLTISGGVFAFTGGMFDDGASTITAAVSALNEGLTTNGDAVFFTLSGDSRSNAGTTGEAYLFVERGDDDLIVQVDDMLLVSGQFGGANSSILQANNGADVNTLTLT